MSSRLAGLGFDTRSAVAHHNKNMWPSTLLTSQRSETGRSLNPL